MKTFKAMLKTELRLSLRGMDMLIFAICLPVVMMVILGIIYGNKPAFDGADYTFLQQSFGAVATIAICAGGVMGLPLVVSDYRHKKILKRFKVTPVSPALILAVQIVIYALYSLVSLLLVYIVAAVFFGFRLEGSWLYFLGAYLLVMVSIFSIGMMVGGIAPNTKIAGVVASILYFPMLIFSGATLPYEMMPAMLQKTADILPLTQGIKLLKAASLGLPVSSILFPTTVIIAITQTAEQITQYVSKADQSRYLSFSAQNGVLIGDTATSYKVQILSDRVNILQNGAVIAYFASSKLFITEGELTSNLKIGNYGLKKTVDGGIAIG